MFGGKKGVSLLYVLMALVCVGAMGSLVLNMAKKEKSDSSLRYSSELARYGATSGLVWGANFFNNPENTDRVIDILGNWKDESKRNNLRWITGSDNSQNSFLEIDGMKFRVKIVNIDFSQLKNAKDNDFNPDNSYFTAMLESESIDKSGSRAKNVGFYKITGFSLNIDNDNIPTYAFYLGGGNMWIHCPVTINGKTYIGNHSNTGTAIYHTASTGSDDNKSYYKGEFRLYQGENVPPSNLSYEEFEGPAYFEGGRVAFIKSAIDFKKGFGGSAKFYAHESDVNVSDGTAAQKNRVVLSYGFSAAGVTGYKIKFMGENTELHYTKNGIYQKITSASPTPIPTDSIVNDFPSDRFVVFSGGSSTDYTTRLGANGFKNEYSNDIDNEKVQELLRMEEIGEPRPCIIDLSDITGSTNNIKYSTAASQYVVEADHGSKNQHITGDTLNKWYDSPPQGKKKYKDKWLVVRTSAVGAPLSGDGNAFTGKAIIIHQGIGSLGSGHPVPKGGLPRVSNAGNILFYIPPIDASPQVTISYLDGSFRGMFYNASSNTTLTLNSAPVQSAFGISGNWTVNGAFYNAPELPNAVIQLGTAGAGRITVNYDRQALQELADIGIFGKPSDTNEPLPIEKVDNYQGKSNMLGRGF